MPEEHSGLGGAGEEEVGVERIPDNLVDWSHVDAVGHQELGGEFCGAKVNVSLLSANQELGVQVRLEGNTSHPVNQSLLELLQESQIQKRNNSDRWPHLGLQTGLERQQDDVRGQHVGLHDGPVGDTAVRGAAVEVEVAVQVIIRPADLPHHLTVLPRTGLQEAIFMYFKSVSELPLVRSL